MRRMLLSHVRTRNSKAYRLGNSWGAVICTSPGYLAELVFLEAAEVLERKRG